jgi:hypothetical protein
MLSVAAFVFLYYTTWALLLVSSSLFLHYLVYGIAHGAGHCLIPPWLPDTTNRDLY